MSLLLHFSLVIGASIITVIFGFCFLLIVPKGQTEYRVSRVALACAYFILATINILEVCINPSPGGSIRTALSASLIIASFQALLFSSSMISLFEREFISQRRFLKQLASVFSFSIILVLSLTLFPRTWVYAYWGFIVFYLLQLFFYTWAFIRRKGVYKKRMEEYFSDDEPEKLNWITKAFFSALGIGVVAAFFLVIMEKQMLFLFIIIYSLFYFYFAIKYINYLNHFAVHAEKPIQEEKDKVPAEEVPAPNESLFDRVNRWVGGKGYLKPGLTITELAAVLGTNRTYLSGFINQTKGMSFNMWINEMRVEEAKRIMTCTPRKPMSVVSDEAGYTDPMVFSKQFRKVTGMSPREWKSQTGKESVPLSL